MIIAASPYQFLAPQNPEIKGNLAAWDFNRLKLYCPKMAPGWTKALRHALACCHWQRLPFIARGCTILP
jgi:hypothetical protein